MVLCKLEKENSSTIDAASRITPAFRRRNTLALRRRSTLVLRLPKLTMPLSEPRRIEVAYLLQWPL